MHSWMTCFSKAQEQFKLADNFLALKDFTAGTEHLVRCQQWLAEAAKDLQGQK